MEWSKIKNIILIILLLVNLFLFVLVTFREERTAQYMESARANAVGVLQKNGIAVDQDSLPGDTDLALFSMERDLKKEAAAAEVLLGTVNQSGQGGIIQYTGERGTARFSRSGEFSADFLTDAYPLGTETPTVHALRVLSRMDFDGEVLALVEDGTCTLLKVRQLWQGIPVFTCRATLVYEGGALISVRDGESFRLTGLPVLSGAVEHLSVATALMRFLEGINQLGDVCTTLTGITPGYIFSSGLTDPITLRPAWYITTDTGAYYLDAGTGILERAN